MKKLLFSVTVGHRTLKSFVTRKLPFAPSLSRTSRCGYLVNTFWCTVYSKVKSKFS